MEVKIISCWFKTSYASYTDSLRQALGRELGTTVGVIASNCGCNDPMDGVFYDKSADYFEFPNLTYWRSPNPVKRWIRSAGRQILYHERAKLFQKRAMGADVLHFQQTLNAYGSLVVFNWLRLPSQAARVITVHELDDYQTDNPAENQIYNSADRLIVHAGELREALVKLGVDRDRIDLVEHGVDILPESTAERSGIVFYGGHKLNAGKGLKALCAALALVRKEMGAATPVLKIHGYYGDGTREYGFQCAAEAGVTDLVQWLDRIDNDEVVRVYRESLLCVLPFKGSFAGYAVSTAMANGVAVIGTRFAGMPEHLGDTGTYVEPEQPEALAQTMLRLLRNPEERVEQAARARVRAIRELSWDAVARKTALSYAKAVAHHGDVRTV